MANPFIGEIRIFAGSFAPRDWAFCDGSLLNVAQNTALFSLISTVYGGDGRNNFALPNLQGRAPLHYGGSQGSGLSSYRLGQKGGVETVTLTLANMGAHKHNAIGSDQLGNATKPTNNVVSEGPNRGDNLYASFSSTEGGTGSFSSLGTTGGGESHTNLQPLLVINFIIALAGTYPSRS